MKMTSLTAGASRFAHFAGLTRSSRSMSEDDERCDDAEDDDDGKDASEDDGDDEPKGKKSRRADDDDDGKDAGDDDDGKDASEDDGDDEPKGKKSRRADDDDDGKDAADDDDDEMKGKGAVASARRREQARIAHILGHKAAANNPVLAISLACETRMSRKEAVAVLRSQPASAQGNDRGRHARQDRQDRNTDLSGDAGKPTGQQALDASWGRAFGKAGIKPR